LGVQAATITTSLCAVGEIEAVLNDVASVDVELVVRRDGLIGIR
jgi:hypothetical protein